MKEIERQLKALANKRRLLILKFLRTVKRASVSEIAHEIKLSHKATSKHLTILTVADVVEREQVSRSVFYVLTNTPAPVAKYTISLL